MDSINILLLLAGILLFISVVASTLSARLGMPLLLVFLAVGMLAGEEGIGHIKFDSYNSAAMIGQLALAVILLDGGLRTSLKSFRMALKPAAVLASWGVIATVACLGLFVTFFLGIDWRMGMLMAAIVGSTDAAAVFSLLRNSGVKLNERVQSTLEIESGANDPMAILLVTVMIQAILHPEDVSVFSFIITLIKQMGIGAVLGVAAGWVLARLTSRLNLNEGMYALLILGGGLVFFSFINLLGGSGFLAVYLGGIIIGNRHSHATEHVLRVMDGLAWLSQAGLFVALGLLATPSHLIEHWHKALFIALFLTFVARPFAVLTSLWKFRYPRNELIFTCWVGLRGAVPVTLAIMPVTMGVPDSEMLFNVAFVVVILSLLVQGASIPTMAKLCKVNIPGTLEPVNTAQLWVDRNTSLPMVAFHADSGCNAIGRKPRDIAADVDGASVKYISTKRGKEILPLDSTAAVEAGDLLWFTVPEEHSAELAAWFNNTDEDMEANLLFFGPFSINGSAKIGDLAHAYGLEIPEEEHQFALRDWMLEKLDQSQAVVGDRVWGKQFTLTVRETDNQGDITLAGLKV